MDQFRGNRVAVILPCYNEAPAIASVVAGFRAALPEARIYVFDNAFTFRSPSFAAASAILLLLATTVLIAVQVRRTSVEVNVE